MARGFFSRGFRGRRRSQDTVLPPGQYLEDGFPVLSAGPTPRTPLEEWDFSIVGEIDEPKRWTWEEFSAATLRGDHKRHPLRHQVVEAGHQVGRGLHRHVARRSRNGGRVRHGLLRRRLHHQSTLGGCHGRQGVGCLRIRRGAPGARARRTCTAAGAAPVLLEERQVGEGTAAHYLRRPRLLGVLGLPQLRRPLARAALLGRLGRWLCSRAGLSGA